MRHDITVVGSLNIDLVTVVSRMPAAGETLRATSFTTGFGGKGANQAVACARLLPKGDASRVHMIGCVGEDRYGEDFQRHLQREGIDYGQVDNYKGEKTGTSLILIDESSGENRIVYSEGANARAQGGKMIKPSNDSKSMVVFQLETPIQGVLKGLELAKSMRMETFFNPAPASPLPEHIYQSIDHLIMNETEACLLSGTPEADLSGSLEAVADKFTSWGTNCVIITLGSNGVFWKLSSDRNGHTMAARKVKAIDTTAAGDTFVGAYVAHLSQRELPAKRGDIYEAIEFATRAAAITVQSQGAQTSIPHLNEVQESKD